MSKRIATKVTTLLYNAMTNEELKEMDIDELRMFWTTLHHWQKLALRQIDVLQKEGNHDS